MITIETKNGKHQIKFYDSPKDDLTIRRYAKFNKHMMVKSQVGNTMDDYMNRHGRAIAYIDAEDNKSAKTELINQQQCVFNALEEYTPEGMGLAVLVHSIDGVEYSGYDDDTLNGIIDKLSEVGFTQAMMERTLKDVKKK